MSRPRSSVRTEGAEAPLRGTRAEGLGRATTSGHRAKRGRMAMGHPRRRRGSRSNAGGTRSRSEWVVDASVPECQRTSGTAGGEPVTLGEAPFFSAGGSWGMDDTIIFEAADPSTLWRVSADGGTPEALTAVDVETESNGTIGYDRPQILPGGRAVLFGSARYAGFTLLEGFRIAVLMLDTGETKVFDQLGDRIVSPMPSYSSTPRPTAVRMEPASLVPASVIPRCNG